MDCISLFEYLWIRVERKCHLNLLLTIKFPSLLFSNSVQSQLFRQISSGSNFLQAWKWCRTRKDQKFWCYTVPFIMPAKTFESLIVLPPYSASYQMLWTLNWADSDGKGSVTKSFASTLSTDVPLNFQSYPRQKLTGAFAYFLRVKLKLQERQRIVRIDLKI